MSTDENSRKRQARVAGVLYLLAAVAAVISLKYVPSWSIELSDPAVTASRIATSPLLYRIGIVSDLAGQVLFVFLVFSLYQLLKVVNSRLAALMVALVLVQIPMAFANMLIGMAPLILNSGSNYLSAFNESQLDTLAMVFAALRSYGVSAVMAFWGLWLLPFGLLVYRSRFIPRVLGIFLIVGCFAHLTVGVTSLLFPDYARIVSPLKFLAIGEVLIILWLLVKGVKTDPLEEKPST